MRFIVRFFKQTSNVTYVYMEETLFKSFPWIFVMICTTVVCILSFEQSTVVIKHARDPRFSHVFVEHRLCQLYFNKTNWGLSR